MEVFWHTGFEAHGTSEAPLQPEGLAEVSQNTCMQHKDTFKSCPSVCVQTIMSHETIEEPRNTNTQRKGSFLAKSLVNFDGLANQQLPDG